MEKILLRQPQRLQSRRASNGEVLKIVFTKLGYICVLKYWMRKNVYYNEAPTNLARSHFIQGEESPQITCGLFFEIGVSLQSLHKLSPFEDLYQKVTAPRIAHKRS